MLHPVASIHACPGLPDPRLAFMLQHASVNVCAIFTQLICPYPPCNSPSNLIQDGPALEKFLQPYCPCSIPHPTRPIFAQSMSIEPCPVRGATRATKLGSEGRARRGRRCREGLGRAWVLRRKHIKLFL